VTKIVTRENKMITYLAGAYTSNTGDESVDRRIEQAREDYHCFAASELWDECEQGDTVFSPIAHGCNIARFLGKRDNDFYMQHCLVMLQLCDRLVVIKDAAGSYNSSFGTQEEIKYAEELEIPIEYRRF
jgi:hypothetical protein